MIFEQHDMANEQPGESMSNAKRNQCSSDTLPLVPAAMRAKIETAFRNKQVQIQLWSDGAGRVYRIQVISSTGNARLDSIIRDDVLRSLMLSEPHNEMPTVPDDAGHLAAENNRQAIQHVE